MYPSQSLDVEAIQIPSVSVRMHYAGVKTRPGDLVLSAGGPKGKFLTIRAEKNSSPTILFKAKNLDHSQKHRTKTPMDLINPNKQEL